MQIGKKLVSAMMAVVLAAGLCPAAALAAPAQESDTLAVAYGDVTAQANLVIQNDKSQVQVISLNQSYTGSLYSSDSDSDADWFKFTLSETSRISLYFGCSVVPDEYWGSATKAQLYRGSASSASYSWDITGSKKWSSKNLYLPKGTYYVCLSADSYRNTWGKKYSFKVTATALSRTEQEPNGKRSQSRAISPNKPYLGTLYAPGSQSDSDWYKFTLSKPSRVSLYFASSVVPDEYWGNSTSARLYSASTLEYNDHWDYSWDITGTKKWSSKNLYLPMGTYYVRLNASKDRNTWGKDYTFKVSAKATARIETELNGKRAKSDKIAVNRAYTGTLYAPGQNADQDWFKFTLSKTSWVTFQFNCSVVPDEYWGNFTRMRIYSDRTLEYTNSSDYRWNITGTKKWTSRKVKLPKGTYYVLLSASKDRNTWGQDYTLKVQTL